MQALICGLNQYRSCGSSDCCLRCTSCHPTSTPLVSRKAFHSLTQPLIPRHSNKRQTPQLPYITLRLAQPSRRRQSSKLNKVKPCLSIIRPAPQFERQVLHIRVDEIPQVIVRADEVLVDWSVRAEVWLVRGSGVQRPICRSSPAAIMASCQDQTTVPW